MNLAVSEMNSGDDMAPFCLPLLSEIRVQKLWLFYSKALDVSDRVHGLP